MTLMRAFATVGFNELDAFAFHTISRANRHAISANDLSMFLDFRFVGDCQTPFRA